MQRRLSIYVSMSGYENVWWLNMTVTYGPTCTRIMKKNKAGMIELAYPLGTACDRQAVSHQHITIASRHANPDHTSLPLPWYLPPWSLVRSEQNTTTNHAFPMHLSMRHLELQVNNGNGDTQKSRTLAQTLSPTSKKSETFSTLPAAIAEMCAKPSWKKTLTNVAQEVTCHRNQWKKWWVFPKSPLSL